MKLGRSLERTTAMIAVSAGAKPTSTAPCFAGTSLRAYEVKSGNPIMMPREMMAKLNQCFLWGIASRLTIKNDPAKSAATMARPKPTKVPPSSGAATLVAGIVRLKARMPMNPQIKPHVF
jgi:hypothetical protein